MVEVIFKQSSLSSQEPLVSFTTTARMLIQSTTNHQKLFTYFQNIRLLENTLCTNAYF